MGNGGKSLLVLLTLLHASLSFGRSILQTVHVCTGELKTWEEARQFCQANHVDLSAVTTSYLKAVMRKLGISFVWTRLQRNPGNESFWSVVPSRFGDHEGVRTLHTPPVQGEPRRHCALVNASDSMWYSVSCSKSWTFHCSDGKYHDRRFPWVRAKRFCEGEKSNLSTQANGGPLTDGWIGLYRVAKDRWQWTDNEVSNSTNWATGEPRVSDCSVFSGTTGLWYSKPCSEKFPFICFHFNLVVVKENKTWEEALEHCRSLITQCPEQGCAYKHELLSLQDYEIKIGSYLMENTTTDEVWTGLRFLAGAWVWVNDAAMNFEMPSCPSLHQHCGSLSRKDGFSLQARDCLEKKNFICYKYRVNT